MSQTQTEEVGALLAGLLASHSVPDENVAWSAPFKPRTAARTSTTFARPGPPAAAALRRTPRLRRLAASAG